MNRRKLIAMSDEEIQAFLQEERTLQIATSGRDGYPHLVAMWYILFEGQIAFWTYARSQKAVNLRRDARLTCLAEAGQNYEDLRGVQIKGQATIYEDLPTVQRFGELIWERYTGPLDENTRPMVTAQAAKRIVVVVKPVEIASWDHRKLAGKY
ncbi:MAG TPA: pyridoxamine 5'-phosphate oxidase family protein [Ktedonobacteraceae bacterium]